MNGLLYTMKWGDFGQRTTSNINQKRDYFYYEIHIFITSGRVKYNLQNKPLFSTIVKKCVFTRKNTFD